MPAHGPFCSLSDEDKRILTIRLDSGLSVCHAADELSVNYTHALNFAHALGLGYRPTLSKKTLTNVVKLAAAGTSLASAARQCRLSVGVVTQAAISAGVHTPQPCGHAVTTRRVAYLHKRLTSMSRKELLPPVESSW